LSQPIELSLKIAMKKIFKAWTASWTVLLLVLSLSGTSAYADRIKDLTTVAAMRSNQLIGYGLVVGLQGTGDGADVSFTAQSMKTLLNRLGVSMEGPLSDFETATSSGKLDIKNVAAVMVTAELPGFAKPGQKIDITVSAIGKASNLRGGTLLLSSLRGVDGEIYALAQGALTATGIDAAAAGSKVVVGVPTAARIPSGATVERVVDNPFDKADRIVLNVRESDFTTTNAIVSAINGRFGADVARALDGVSITLQAPQDLTQRVAFMSMIENMDVMPGEPPARVVINAKTGTVVISRNVRVTAAAVTHGTISVAISATNEISQPGAFSQGQTAAVQNAEVTVSEANKPMFLFQPGVDLRQIVDAVNQVGASPSSLIAILEALKSSGSLRAELIVI
jgi:flagellar P-ring protein precursor FlgI